MVFTKLTDTDREQLAIFGQEHDKKQVSMMRALIMRGATPSDVKAMAIEREKARNDVVEALETVSYTHSPSPRDRTRSRMPSSA